MEEIDADCGNNLFSWREKKRTAIDHTHTHTHCSQADAFI